MTLVDTGLVTIEEFLALPSPKSGGKLELVRGKVVEMPPPQGEHGIVCGYLAGEIHIFLKGHPIAWMATNDTGTVLENDPDSLRGPDVGVWLKANHPDRPAGYFECPPDLAIEVLSPTDRRGKVRDKIRQYIDADVKLVWLVDPEAQTVTVYRGDMKGIELGESETLHGDDVLPGFAVKIADLFQ
jgi:Uma2 family endonuclease